ncbi:MAG: PAS domain-containing protein [Moraxellaceae bacterium]|nr:PAS domain-containing protein [Moraxellaceae bacterium]
MEENRPLIDKEIQIKKGMVLVTITDLKGIIFYANDEFISTSGFTRDELIGASHTMTHHPDMPPVVVEDLRISLKALRPWQGIIKNRTKSGDYYWSETTVMPVVKNGKVHECLSVRRTPSREQIEQAEHVYRLLNTKQTIIRPSGLAAIVKSVKEVDVWKKMALALAAFLLPAFYLMHQLFLAQDYPLLASVAGSITIASAIGFNVIKNFTTMLNKTIGIFYRMVEKKFGNAPGLARNELFGDIQRTLYLMEMNLDLAKIKDDASRTLQNRQELDHIHVGVMLTNNNFEVVYMNDSVLEMFKKTGSASSTQLSNQDINNFHSGPVQQERLSTNFKEPYGSELHIAGQVIRFSISS